MRGKDSKTAGRSVGREAGGLALLGLSILILASLFSYDPLDPVLSRYTAQTVVHNWAGRIGANLGGGLVEVLGLAALWIPGVLGWWAIKLLGRSYKAPSLSTVVGLAFLVPATAGLISLFWPKLTWAQEPVNAGGWAGAILAGVLTEWLKPLGAALILIVVLLAGLMLAVDMSLMAFLEAAGQSGGTFLGRLKTAKTIRQEKKERTKSESYQRLRERLDHEPPKIVVEEPTFNEPVKIEPVQEVLPFMAAEGRYNLPPLSLLDDPPKSRTRQEPKWLTANSRRLEKKLFDFGVEGQVVEVNGGPVITMYEFKPAPGIKISRITNLADDLALALKAEAIRVVGPLPGKGTMGVEIPNATREMVILKEILSGAAYQEAKGGIPLVLGKDAVGRPYVTDLTKMPHLLIAGATGSGKSVCLNSMLMSILYRSTPADVRLLMVDPKRIELSVYDGIPHLLHPVLTNPQKATKALRWAVLEMESRYELLARANVRSIGSYNQKAAKGELKPVTDPDGQELEMPERLPYIVIIIDELADLMMVASREVEESLIRLAQMARAAGIHLVLATQRPSVDVLTGIIKANFPARIAFQVASKTDSRTILDGNGAENLLGAGDMLFLPPGVGKLTRVHGAFVSDAEIKAVTEFLRDQGRPDYNEEVVTAASREAEMELDGEVDERYEDAVRLVMETGKASISLVQRKLRVGYNRAARMIEMMAAEGLVSEPDHTNTRRVLVGTPEEV